MIKIPLWLCIFIGVLSGCSHVKPLEVFTAPIEMPSPPCTVALPFPDPIRTYPIHWEVITAPGVKTSYFALDARGYTNLSKSLMDTQRWVSEASGQLRYYHKGVQ